MITKSLYHINKRNSCKTLKTQNIKLNSGKNGKKNDINYLRTFLTATRL